MLKRYLPYEEVGINYFIDDFMGAGLTGRVWSTSAGSGTYEYLASGLGGLVRVRADANNFYWLLHDSVPAVLSSARSPYILWRVKIDNLTSVRAGCGLVNSTTDDVEWFYDSSLGSNWRYKCRAANTETVVDSGIAADTNWHEFRVDFNSSVAIFYLDGVLIGRITTNIPSVALGPMLRVTSLTAAVRYIYADYVETFGDRV